jgi:hypothetical protein
LYQKVIDAAQAKTQLKQLDPDLKKETLLVHTPIDWTDVLRETEKLGAAHNQVIGCGSADLFHVAAAIETRCDTFLTLDDLQTVMAKTAGLTVKP